MAGAAYQPFIILPFAHSRALPRFLPDYYLVVFNDVRWPFSTVVFNADNLYTTVRLFVSAPLSVAHRSQQRLTNLASRLFRVIHPAPLKHFCPHKMSPVVLETPVINMHNAPLGSMPRIQQFPAAQQEQQPSNSSSSETRQGSVPFIHIRLAIICLTSIHS